MRSETQTTKIHPNTAIFHGLICALFSLNSIACGKVNAMPFSNVENAEIEQKCAVTALAFTHEPHDVFTLVQCV